MKKKLNLLLVLLLPIFISQGQENKINLDHKNYVFNTSISIDEVEFDKETFIRNLNSPVESTINQRFKIVHYDEKYLYIKIYDYDEKSDSQKKYVGNGTNKFFRIGKAFFDEMTDEIYPIYAGETFGLVSIPFKIRLGKNDFETNANIGLNAGFMYRLNRKVKDRWILQPNIGIGLADVPLNESNSDVEKAENRTALSISLGLMLNISSDINIGMFYGFDRLNKANQDVNWKYQNKHWLGIGINIGFSTKEATEGELKNKDKD